jgi:hypothetical protein
MTLHPYPAPPPRPPSFAQLVVRSAPRIDDPRELQTILLTSLRALWGDLETYSHGVEVSRTTFNLDDCGDGESNSGSRSADGIDHLLYVKCPVESVPAVRAALTMVTPPPYMEDAVYCLDVVRVGEVGAG